MTDGMIIVIAIVIAGCGLLLWLIYAELGELKWKYNYWNQFISAEQARHNQAVEDHNDKMELLYMNANRLTEDEDCEE